jgi:hypothetical protein
MKLGIASIQRNRGKWIVEWLAFHMLVGFESFYIYAHKTNDGMTETLLKLARRYNIKIHLLDEQPQPQLQAYHHALNAYGREVDWLAFLDGDEFLLPAQGLHVGPSLAQFETRALSALAVYWVCYGSNGHVKDPDGLVLQDYPRHSAHDYLPNRHVKSIVRGGQAAQVQGSHIFHTPLGTFDEQHRPVHHGWMRDLEPSYQHLRLNHYAVQSYDFFRQVKQNIGAADGNPNLVRPDSWFFDADRNECDDGWSYRFLVPLKLKFEELQAVLANT